MIDRESRSQETGARIERPSAPQLTAETTALAKYIDGIVIVVRSGKTPKSLVNELINDLGREKILGVVLNGYKTPATERYGYGRYKEYKKGYKK